jgi:hypothetical protein
VLRSPDFSKYFFLYTFASDQLLVAVLTQKDDDNKEAPISFMSTNIQWDELNYPVIDKKAYAVYKAMKQFRSYILKNHTKVIVPHPAVQSLFSQHEMEERRGNWMEVVQEFDLDTKPAKILKEQRLCKLAAKSQNQVNEDHRWENELAIWCGEASYVSPGKESWYEKLNYLLHHGTCPKNLNPKERRALRLKSTQNHLINLVLFRVNYDGLILICLKCEDAVKVMKELHDGPVGGHLIGNTIAHKILRAGYYWPTLFKYAHTYTRNYKTCQISSGREKREVVPLQPVVVSRTFKKWGLYIIGEITSSSSKQNRYILTATNYFTKWEEVIPLTHVNEKVVIPFIEKQLITRFGILSILVFDNEAYFYSNLLTYFSLDKGIIIKYSANCYPWGNEVAESTNRNLVRILKKKVAENQGNWHISIHNALWDDRVTPKEAIGNSPYFLVYRQEAILPNGLYLPSFQLSQDSRGQPSLVIQQRIDTLLMLEEEKEKEKSTFISH